MTRTALVLVLLAAGACASLAGCAAEPPNARTVTELSRLPYPKDAQRGDDLDIVARQKRGTLVLINRTPRGYDNVQIWINQQYVTRPRRIRTGVSPGLNRFPLVRFIDQHGRSYPVAGPITPDRRFPVVLVELFDPATGRKHPLLSRDPLTRGNGG
jgi:hypothetical protein